MDFRLFEARIRPFYIVSAVGKVLLKQSGINVVVDVDKVRDVLEASSQTGSSYIEFLSKQNKKNQNVQQKSSREYPKEDVKIRLYSTITPDARSSILSSIEMSKIKINNGQIDPISYIRILKQTFGFKEKYAKVDAHRIHNSNISEYTYNKIGDTEYLLRLSNHSSNANTFKEFGHERKNIAIVITMSDKQFVANDDVYLIDYTYFADKLTKERMIGILDGLKDWINTGIYTHKDYDYPKESPRQKTGRKHAEEKDPDQFLKTAMGEVYGLVHEGKIYLDPDVLDVEAPIHEYTHLWDAAVRASNPSLWEHGKNLMKQIPLWEDVKSDPFYATIADNEDLLASEVHARLTSPEGREILSSMEKTGGMGIVDRIRSWLRDAMQWVRDAFSVNRSEISNVSIEEWSMMPLKSLSSGAYDTLNFTPDLISSSAYKEYCQTQKAAETVLEINMPDDGILIIGDYAHKVARVLGTNVSTALIEGDLVDYIKAAPWEKCYIDDAFFKEGQCVATIELEKLEGLEQSRGRGV